MRMSASRTMIWSCLVMTSLLLVACPPKKNPITVEPNPTAPEKASMDWENWSRNLLHKRPGSGEYNYFLPTTRAKLKEVVASARAAKVQLRVSGQRHSQPPLVADDNRGAPPLRPKTWLIDLSCYKDLGDSKDEQIVLDVEKNQVKVSAGVREEYLEAFLAKNNFMLKTVTAGGFFSLGGMTAIDVHGATLGAPIFAETAAAFEIMGPDGEVTPINAGTDGVGGWKAIQFARVSLGALGIVTSVTLDIEERPLATTIKSGHERIQVDDEVMFVEKFTALLNAHYSLESFYDPYSGKFLVLWWDVESAPDDPIANPETGDLPTACDYAQQKVRGAPFEDEFVEWLAEGTGSWVQFKGSELDAQIFIDAAFTRIEGLANDAAAVHSNHWLTSSPRAAFMSYYVELPLLDEAGLIKVWKALNVVKERVQLEPSFRLAAPLEFRFVKGGSSALSGTYKGMEPDAATFVNLDIIFFTPKTRASEYPQELLDFAANVELNWYNGFGGLPHNGKMYGFYDPTSNATTPPHSPGFMSDLAAKRGAPLAAFETFRKQRDPDGMFCNDFLRSVSLCVVEEPDE